MMDLFGKRKAGPIIPWSGEILLYWEHSKSYNRFTVSRPSSARYAVTSSVLTYILTPFPSYSIDKITGNDNHVITFASD
jgi:hypothetical protein